KEKKSREKEIVILLDRGLKQRDIAAQMKCKEPYVTQVKQKAILAGYMDESGKLTTEGIEHYNLLDEDNDEELN
ncbi:MAG: hypothetical protein ABSB79_15550, partial [Syntrophales bacterium]